MFKTLRTLPLIVVAQMLVMQGCSTSRSGGLLSGAGLGDASSVRLVLVGNSQVTDRTIIRNLYAAVDQPDTDYVSRMARSRQIAFVGNNRRVVYLSYSDAGDLTDRQASRQFMGVLGQVFKNPASRKPVHVHVGGLTHVKMKLKSRTAVTLTQSSIQWKTSQRLIVRLLKQWNPNDLSGCKRYRQHELDKLSDKYIEVKLSRPTSFETLIVPRDFEWWPPPSRVENRPRFERVDFDTIRLMSVRPETIRLAFKQTGTTHWIVSSVVGTKEFLGYGPQGQSRFGPNLFNQLVSQITKP